MTLGFRRYLLVLLLLAGVLTGGRWSWNETLEIGCLPEGGSEPAGAWLSYCASDKIGDVDHSAIWFGLRSEAVDALVAAQVLLFGDSRMMLAASGPGVASWFAERHVTFYNLAFSSGEQSGWAERLVSRYRPRARVMVFDTAPYFTGGFSQPAQAILDDPSQELSTGLATKAFIDAAPRYCGLVPMLCGRTFAGYRMDDNGQVVNFGQQRWWFGHQATGSFPILRPPPTDTSQFPAYLENARKMLAEAQIRPSCMVLTVVPNGDFDDSLARYLAANLGVRVVAPQIDGLATSDHFHLTWPSAQIWTQALLAGLAPIINECLGEQRLSGSVATTY